MKKAFDGQGREIGSRELNEILAAVLDNLAAAAPLTVERVQDEVERTLMERGYYEVAKAYILYREKRSVLRRVRHTIAQTVGDNSLDEVLRRIQMDFTEEIYSLAALQMKFESFCRPGMTEDERAEALTKAAVELTTAEAVSYTHLDVYKRQPGEYGGLYDRGLGERKGAPVPLGGGGRPAPRWQRGAAGWPHGVGVAAGPSGWLSEYSLGRSAGAFGRVRPCLSLIHIFS